MSQRAFNPEMLLLARQFRGLSQGELASRVGISQGRLSKMETGIGSSAPEEIVAGLSGALEVPTSFFFQGETRLGVGVTEIYHRKRERLGAKQLDRIHATTEVMRLHVQQLLDAVEKEPRWSFPRLPIDDFDGDGSAVARAVRACWKMSRGPVPSVTRLIEEAGGIVIRCRFGTSLIDGISRWVAGQPPMFFMNVDFPGDRYRYTLSHELGHVVMHNEPNPQMEEQADTFAAEFLMPADDIRVDLTAITIQKLATLKPYWLVSMAALLKRASSLRRISERQARFLWMRLGQLGFRTSEPPEIAVPQEEPLSLSQLLKVHRTELGYSVDELATALHATPSMLHELYSLREARLQAVQ